MKIILNDIFSKSSFLNEKTEKEVIILQNIFFNMKKFDIKEPVHYVISKEGIVYQLVDPDFWIPESSTANKKNIDRKSIFIGLLNEGKLTKRSDGKFYYYDKVYKEYKEPIFESEETWKGEKYFATYKEAQLFSLLNLLQYLFDRFTKIDKFFSNEFIYNEKWFSVRGIILKCNILKYSLDLTPAFPIERFNRQILKFSREEIMNFVKVILIEFVSLKEYKNSKKVIKK